MTRLRVSLSLPQGAVEVGHIDWAADRRVAAFQFSPAFLADPWPISPLRLAPSSRLLLADPAPFDGLHGAFADSLPDGWGRLLVDREAASRGVPAGALTPVDRLAIVGAHGMGALIYEPASDGWGGSDVDLGWFAETAMRVEEGAGAPDLQRLRDLQGGSAGARPKLLVQLDPATGALLDHRQPLRDGFGHWLVKFRNSRDPVHLPEVEAAYMAMARAAGIETPAHLLLRDARGRSFFATKRFDRQGDARLHMQSAAALLNLDFRTPALDYDNLLKLIGAMTRDRRQVAQGVRRMVFNVMAHNRDDHAKNHAFLMGADRVWRLSPAYDATFSDGPGGEHSLAIAGEGRRPTAEHLIACAERAGTPAATTRQIIDEVRAAVLRWRDFADEAGVPSGPARDIAQTINQTTAQATESVGLIRPRG